MRRRELLELLGERLLELERPHPVRVAVDGPDGAGKTMLADELAELLAGRRTVIRAGIDGFHNPRELRYRRGPDSPEGYFLDSFDYEALRTILLAPLGPGGSLRFRRKIFDYRIDEEVEAPEEESAPDAIVLFDGVFLLRPELRPFWDFSIFVQADFDETRSPRRGSRPGTVRRRGGGQVSLPDALHPRPGALLQPLRPAGDCRRDYRQHGFEQSGGSSTTKLTALLLTPATEPPAPAGSDKHIVLSRTETHANVPILRRGRNERFSRGTTIRRAACEREAK